MFDGKGKIVFSCLMLDNWLTMDDMHAYDTCLCISRHMLVSHAHAWLIGLNF